LKLSVRNLKLIFALCWALGLCVAQGRPSAWAQAGLHVEAFPAPVYTFGKVVTFRVTASSNASIREVTLFYRVEPAADVVAAPAAFAPGRVITGIVTLDMEQAPLTPFAQVQYWWEVTDQAQAQETTQPQTFHYLDNRFTWQTLSQSPVTVHWYDGNPAFGQTALSAAITGLTQASLTVGVSEPEALDIYIYADITDAQEALQPSGHLWSEGRTDPGLNLAIVTVTPGVDSDRELGRELPHEMMHLLLAQRLGAGYARLPNWLNEGLAVMNQAQADPELALALTHARDAQSLFLLANLCGPFPADPAQAQLAYAESESVVRYVRRHFPVASLAKLLDAYAQGATCEAGVAQGLNLSQADLEKAWRADLVPAAPALPLGPWIILSAVVFLGGGTLALLSLGGLKSRRP
jgi:hypothetical protein